MLREGWNFHNDVAIPLEGVAVRHFKRNGRPVDTIFDADAIESGTFAEDMILLLRMRYDYRNDMPEIDEFIVDCSRFIGVRGSQIDKGVADNLFQRFENLYDEG